VNSVAVVKLLLKKTREKATNKTNKPKPKNAKAKRIRRNLLTATHRQTTKGTEKEPKQEQGGKRNAFVAGPRRLLGLA
jgi:hypothetical protein